METEDVISGGKLWNDTAVVPVEVDLRRDKRGVHPRVWIAAKDGDGRFITRGFESEEHFLECGIWNYFCFARALRAVVRTGSFH